MFLWLPIGLSLPSGLTTLVALSAVVRVEEVIHVLASGQRENVPVAVVGGAVFK
jgi:hypothetical protein